jgi:hypothetical protein
MSFPLKDNVSNLTFYAEHPTLISTSMSGREQRAQLSSQKWRVDMRLNNLTDADRRTLLGFIAEQKGSLNAFDLELPSDLSDSSGVYSGSITCSGTATAGTTAIAIATSANGLIVLKKGDLVRFTGGVKTYIVTANVTVNSSGFGTMNISPALQATFAGNTAITHKDVKLNVRLDKDNFSYSMSTEPYGSFALNFVEVI